jgi:hypothetical protein
MTTTKGKVTKYCISLGLPIRDPNKASTLRFRQVSQNSMQNTMAHVPYRFKPAIDLPTFLLPRCSFLLDEFCFVFHPQQPHHPHPHPHHRLVLITFTLLQSSLPVVGNDERTPQWLVVFVVVFLVRDRGRSCDTDHDVFVSKSK